MGAALSLELLRVSFTPSVSGLTEKLQTRDAEELMQYAVSRVIVQRLCDDRADLVPYLSRIIDSLERHQGLYHAQLAEVVPVDVIEELHEWLRDCAQDPQAERSENMAATGHLKADLASLERVFLERNRLDD
jgi:hypothetical protein